MSLFIIKALQNILAPVRSSPITTAETEEPGVSTAPSSIGVDNWFPPVFGRNAKNLDYLTPLISDAFHIVLSFLPRSDHVALKLLNRHYSTQNECIHGELAIDTKSPEVVISELMLYMKDLKDLSYSWKGSQHVVTQYNQSEIYAINRFYGQTNHLWWFNFEGVYNHIGKGSYIFCFISQFQRFDVTIQLESLIRGHEGQKIEQKNIKSFQTINNIRLYEITVPELSKIKVTCFEKNELKHNLILRYFLLIPKENFDNQLRQYLFEEGLVKIGIRSYPILINP
jgi:hypothetical protein